jgi:hypothetical protein
MISSLCLSMIFSENRFPLFRIMLPIQQAAGGLLALQRQPRPSRRENQASEPLVRATPEDLEQDDFSSNRHPALSFCLNMIFSENRYPLFRIMR